MDEIKLGDRVRILAPPSILTLASDLGTVVQQDVDDGAWIVRLDAPAFYKDDRGETRELAEVREVCLNLKVIAEQPR